MHGGDIYRQKVALDFSVNVNPLGVPASVIDVLENSGAKIANYPDLYALELRSKLARYHQVPDSCIVCGNGASELIQAICLAYKPKKALVVAPGFSGYLKALKAVGTEVAYHYLHEKEGFRLGRDFCSTIMIEQPEVVFLTNPHNPTGQSLEQIEEIVKVCRERNILLVIDECFIELTDKGNTASMVGKLRKEDRIIVLRAFTKSFALAGLRLGYCICKHEMIRAVVSILPEWNVSVLAQEAGKEAMEQLEHIKKARVLIKEERSYLEEGLQQLGMKTYPSDTVFILFYSKEKSLQEKLLKREILIRDCSDYEGLGEGYYRVAIKKREQNERLLKAIEWIRS